MKLSTLNYITMWLVPFYLLLLTIGALFHVFVPIMAQVTHCIKDESLKKLTSNLPKFNTRMPPPIYLWREEYRQKNRTKSLSDVTFGRLIFYPTQQGHSPHDPYDTFPKEAC